MKILLISSALLLSVLLFSTNINAQERAYDFNNDPTKTNIYKDSIDFINALPPSKDKAYLMYKLTAHYFFKNSDSSIYYAKKVEDYTSKNDFKILQAANHFGLAQLYFMMKSNYALSLYYINLSKHEAEGNNFFDDQFKEDVESVTLACYAGLGNYSKVKPILKERATTAYFKTMHSKVVYNALGMLGESYNLIKDYDSAIKYSLEAIKFNRTAPKEMKWGYPYYIIADSYINKGAFSDALSYLYEGLVYIKQNNIEKDIAQTYTTFAKAHLGLHNTDSAVYYANLAYSLSTKITFTNGILNASELLYKIFDDSKNVDSSFKYLKITNKIKDELSDKSRVNEIENITLNEELREKQIQESAANRKKLIVGFSLFFIIAFTSLTIYNKQKQKSRLRKLEDNRKNNELKAARDLQESMLPKSLPVRSDLDIATFIRSSSEVGGDYYDFFTQDNGTIYSVCGDATGHGVTSGMMVSITKAGLNGIDAQSPAMTLTKLNNVVKKVDLGTLRMSLNIVEIAQDEVKLSSAAMPPIYLFKAKSSIVEEIMNSGLPLGGLRNEGFEQVSRSFQSGDVLIQLSDGLPEAPNAKGEMYDYDKLKGLIQATCHLSAQEIIDTLITSVDEWMEGQHNPDDITLIVTKKR
jgi:serine phosphatase RsbU (regulator of sigma subunit)